MNCNRANILVAVLVLGFVCSALASYPPGPTTKADKLKRCKKLYKKEGIDCESVEYEWDGGCSYQCTCDDDCERTITMEDFDNCGGEKACYKKKCRDVVRDDYDFKKFIGLRDEKNPCKVDLYNRKTRKQIGNVIQDGEKCIDPVTGRPGKCKANKCETGTGSTTKDERLKRCKKIYKKENRRCSSVKYNRDDGCSYQCTCDGSHKRTVNVENFDRCGNEMACYEDECRDVVRCDYNFKKFIALRDVDNPCDVDLYNRKTEEQVGNISQEGKQCTDPKTGKIGKCKDDKCAVEDAGARTATVTQDDMLTRCQRYYKQQNIPCTFVQSNYFGGCSFDCTCDGQYKKTLYFGDFDYCDLSTTKACYSNQCRVIVRGDYDFTRYIGLQDGNNICHVDIYNRATKQFWRHLDQNGTECVDPYGYHGYCQGIECVADYYYYN